MLEIRHARMNFRLCSLRKFYFSSSSTSCRGGNEPVFFTRFRQFSMTRTPFGQILSGLNFAWKPSEKCLKRVENHFQPEIGKKKSCPFAISSHIFSILYVIWPLRVRAQRCRSLAFACKMLVVLDCGVLAGFASLSLDKSVVTLTGIQKTETSHPGNTTCVESHSLQICANDTTSVARV